MDGGQAAAGGGGAAETLKHAEDGACRPLCFCYVLAMNEERDDLKSAIRKAIAVQRQTLKERVAARDPSPEAFRLAIRRRREAYAELKRRVGEEEMTKADIDRLLRFEDRFNALLDRKKR